VKDLSSADVGDGSITSLMCSMDACLQGLRTVNSADGSKEDLSVRGLFYGIGHQPNSKLVDGQVQLDEAGYVKVRVGGLRA